MRQERGENQSSPEINRDILIAYAQTFIPCFDCYPRQNANGSYYAVHEPVTMDILKQHVYGQITLGAYALNKESQARWICLDTDEDEDWQGLLRLAHDLSDAILRGRLLAEHDCRLRRGTRASLIRSIGQGDQD